MGPPSNSKEEFMDVVVLVASLLLRLAAAGAECAPEAALDRRRGAACRWRRYDSAGVVDCWAVMARAGGLPLHFLFVGDSRMRQQFFSFLRVSGRAVPVHFPFRFVL